jgi:hypothetical protein
MLGIASYRRGGKPLVAHVKRQPKVVDDFRNCGSAHVLLRVVRAHTAGNLQPSIDVHTLSALRVAAIAGSDTGVQLSDETSYVLVLAHVAVMDRPVSAADFTRHERQQSSQSGARRGCFAFGTHRYPRVERG